MVVPGAGGGRTRMECMESDGMPTSTVLIPAAHTWASARPPSQYDFWIGGTEYESGLGSTSLGLAEYESGLWGLRLALGG